MILMLAFGMGWPLLRQRGTPVPLLVILGLVFLVVVHVVVGALAKLFPVRCAACRGRGRFQGFGWWPFIYRYRCRQCDHPMRFEVGG
jgi:hypothetical protein